MGETRRHDGESQICPRPPTDWKPTAMLMQHTAWHQQLRLPARAGPAGSTGPPRHSVMVITGGTRPARPRPADAKQQGSWLQRNVTGPLYEQLAAGVTPNSLARSVAMGLTVGVGPLPMLSGIIVGLLSVACGFNMVAGQVAQLVMAPVQLALIVPFMRLGEWMTGWEPTSLEDITRFTEGDILGSLGPPPPRYPHRTL